MAQLGFSDVGDEGVQSKQARSQVDMSENSKNKVSEGSSQISVPRRSLSVEFFVGVFALVGVLSVGYLAVGLGGMQLGSSSMYEVQAEFDNIAGLQKGASVEIGGVPIGEVARIEFNDPVALITMRIRNSVPIRDDDIAMIRTKGIIGDRYIKISRGGSEDLVARGGLMTETESVVDFEDIIGKIVHRMGGEDE